MKLLRSHCLRLIIVLGACIAATTGWSAPRTLEEVARIVSPEARFPFTGPIAVSGDSLIAGSLISSQSGGIEFAVFLFERQAGADEWTFSRTLLEFSDSTDIAQLYVAIDGNLAAATVAGVSFAMERVGANWTVTKLEPAVGDFNFERSDVAVSGDRIVLGAKTDRLAGLIYEKDAAAQWTHVATVLAGQDPSLLDDTHFGPKLDADGDLIAIGSPDPLWNEQQNPGKIHVFRRREDGAWIAVDNFHNFLRAGNQEATGSDVAINRDVIAFSDSAGGVGNVAVFEQIEPDAWVPEGDFRPVDALMRGGNAAPDVGFTANRNYVAVGAGGSVTIFGEPSGGDEIYEPLFNLEASSAADVGSEVSVDGATVAALGPTRSDGRGSDAIYIFRLPDDVTQPALQQDDFEDGNAAGWRPTSSSWSVTSFRGSRVYRQARADIDTRSIRENLDWTDLAVQADVRATSFNGADRFFALITRYVDDNNYYYAALRSSNRVQLVRRVNGVNQQLASVSLPVVVNRNYRVRLEAVGTWLRVYVDGALRLQARDSTFTHGSAGLRSYFAQVQFDNALVSPSPQITLLADNFEAQHLLNWTTQPAGAWSNVSSGASRVARQTFMGGAARAISGVAYRTNTDKLADHIITARARPLSFIPDRDPWFGLIARYRDDLNYIYITVNRNGYISLRKLNDGVIEVFDTAPLTVTTGVSYPLRLEAVGDRLRVYVNGSLVLEGVDAAPNSSSDARGRYGLMTSRASAEFDDVRVVEP